MTLVGPDPAADAFGRSEPFRVGVEEELLIVDERLCLVEERPPLPAPSGAGRFDAEVTEAMVETISPATASATDACGALGALRRDLRDAGIRFLGCGLHPDGRFADVRHTPTPRYDEITRQTRSLMLRTPYCGMHVQVGVPSRDDAIRAFNGMRRWIPLIQGLGANSPFWHGHDSGLASARAAIAASLPRSGTPRAFRDYEDYLEYLEGIFAAAGMRDYTAMWWDLRPHPKLGTVEVRAPDTQSTVRETVAIAALVHGLVLDALEREPGEPLPPEVLRETAFVAARDGVEAELWFDGALRPLPEVAHTAIDLARPHARERGFDGALEEVERMLREGNGAARRRAAHARGGLAAVLDELRADATAGL